MLEEEWVYQRVETRTHQEQIEIAECALAKFSAEWLQNEFGEEITDVVFDALNDYISYHKGQLAAQQG